MAKIFIFSFGLTLPPFRSELIEFTKIMGLIVREPGLIVREPGLIVRELGLIVREIQKKDRLEHYFQAFDK